MINELYVYIHRFFNSKTRFQFPYDKNLIKQLTDSNGLYVLFEEGEEFEFMIGEILVKLLWDKYKQTEAEEINNPITFVEDDESTDRAPDTISFDTQ